jgi:hypothetical protein
VRGKERWEEEKDGKKMKEKEDKDKMTWFDDLPGWKRKM